ncbi:MAG: hydrogenase maturation nickel metallochaperone HypA [Calothrix sp. SM1_5_4]|nr:hydrogenase maturation nickel metallochaperone HypA [Calothrix sp. SM1_5_4]
MHEVSLVASLVDRITEVAAREGFSRVIKIRLRVGALSGVEPLALEFCFSEVVKGSVLEGANLEIERVAPELICARCGFVSTPEDAADLYCAHCRSGEIEVRRGREFNVVDLDVV